MQIFCQVEEFLKCENYEENLRKKNSHALKEKRACHEDNNLTFTNQFIFQLQIILFPSYKLISFN